MSRFTLDTDVRADLDAIWDYVAVFRRGSRQS